MVPRRREFPELSQQINNFAIQGVELQPDGQVVYRAMELPTWMFDRAVCAPMRMDTARGSTLPLWTH